jgi:hypothetical protein
MAKEFMVEKAWLFSDRIRVRFYIIGSDDEMDLTFDFKEHKDVANNAEAFASFLNDKAKSVLGA